MIDFTKDDEELSPIPGVSADFVCDLPPDDCSSRDSYDPRYADTAYKLALVGATDEQMCKAFGVVKETLKRWSERYPRFRQALLDGGIHADAEVAHSLYKRAVGYQHPETKVFCNGGEVTAYNVVKHYPPDTAAGTKWLASKQKHVWRDESHRSMSGPDNGPIQQRIEAPELNDSIKKIIDLL